MACVDGVAGRSAADLSPETQTFLLRADAGPRKQARANLAESDQKARAS